MFGDFDGADADDVNVAEANGDLVPDGDSDDRAARGPHHRAGEELGNNTVALITLKRAKFEKQQARGAKH